MGTKICGILGSMSGLYVELPVRWLKQHCNPLATPPWVSLTFLPIKSPESFIRRHEIKTRLANPLYTPKVPQTRIEHLERIAYLVKHRWKDAIEIDVGVPALGCHVDWMVQDGNHRLAAAIYRYDEYIVAGLSGDLNYAKDLFGEFDEVPGPSVEWSSYASYTYRHRRFADRLGALKG